MDELVIDNLVYIPSKKAAAITGYAKDYIGQLCREGRIEAKLVGRSWYVLESSVKEHRFGTQGAPEAPIAAQESVPVAPQKLESLEKVAPVSTEEAPADESWQPASYIAEPVEEIVTTAHPTSLINTTQEQETSQAASQLEEVQSAWQEWFSKNQIKAQEVLVEPSPSEILINEQEKPVIIEEEEVLEPVSEEIAVPVRISRTYPGSMDIAQEIPVQPKRSIRREHEGRVIKERVRKPQKGGRSNLVLKSLFVGTMILIAAITVIGTGSLDALSPTWAKKPGAVEFLAGVKSIEK